MSGPRITRKVTVEVNKKVTEVGSVSSVVQPSSSSSSTSYNPRRSVFERLGPGAVDRSKSRESYPPDKCRNWLRDGRCPYGNNCRFLHGPYSDQKPRTKSVRSIVQSGSKDRHDGSDEKPNLYHSRSVDSIEYDEEEEEQQVTKKKKRHKSEEDLSDSTPKKTTKSKKKHKEEPEDEDEDRKTKRKRKTHKKRDSSPKSKHHSPKEDEEDWDPKASMLKDFERQMKDVENWEEQGEMDYDRQLELERRRQDLQRQLALMDEEDAAASTEDTAQLKGNEREEEPKKVPIVHSRLHPEPSTGTPSDDGTVPQSTVTKKKKKKKVDSEGEGTKTKKKKDSSQGKKDETKRKVVAKIEEEVAVKKEIPADVERPKKEGTGFVGSSDDTDLPENYQTKKKVRKTPKSASGGGGRDKHTSESHPEGSPPRAHVEEPIQKRAEEEDYRRQGELSPSHSKPSREKRKSESVGSAEEPLPPRRVDDGRSRKSRDPVEYYPSPDEQEDNRKVRSKVVGHPRRPPSSEKQRGEEGRTEDRAGRRETEGRVTSRGPRTPSPPEHVKREDGKHYNDDAGVDSKRKRTVRIPRSPARESTREDAGYRKEGPERERRRHDDPHGKGPRTPSDDELHFSPPPNQAEATRSNRFSERERDLPRRERDMSRERGPSNDQGDQRYPERGGRGHPEGDYDRRRPREDEVPRSRRPPPPRPEDYPRGRAQDDDYQKHRGREEDYPRDTREEEFPRHREREGRDDDYQKPKYRDDRPEDYPPRSRARGERDEGEYLRGRARDERVDEGRGRPPPPPPPPRDVHLRPHDDVEGNERDLRDERGRGRPEGYADSRSRERPDDRERDPRYGGTSEPHYRRLSPSQGPARGRSPPHRYDDRRRVDDGYRAGPGGRDASVGRGRGYERGRGEYPSPYDNRGRPMDARRRTPPPGPRPSFQDRDRGPPRGRDVPPGRGRGYIDKGRPPNERYRDSGAPWDRRTDRDYRDHRKSFEDPGIRDRHSRNSSPPPQGFRDQRPWDERDRRGSPPRAGSIPLQDRRPPYEPEHEGRGRPEPRERRSMEGGSENWEYEEHNQRKRPRPTPAVSSRPGSPFEPKKLREQSPVGFNADPSLADIPAAPEEPLRPKKTTITKDGKKIKKKKIGKKEGKAIKGVISGDGSAEPLTVGAGVEEGKVLKMEKKQKKEKKMKEKGVKKKKKAAAAAAVPLEEAPVGTLPVEESGITRQEALETMPATAAPKLGKKRKQAVALEGEQQVGKDAEKPKKKKKKKHQPEVVVQPWADLEGEEDMMEDNKVQDNKETKESVDKPPTTDAAKPEKSQDEMFSDWSDGDSPVGEDNWFDENDQRSPAEQKIDETPATAAAPATAKSSPSSDDRGPSFDDVYDPISDDEFEAMYTQSDEEEEEVKREKVDTTSKALGIEDVDWGSLGISQEPKKEQEPGSHLEKFTPGHVFSRIGISPTLAGQRLTQLVQEACAKVKTGKQETGNELFIPEEGPKCIGAFVAAAAARKRDREALLGNLGPCRRALCARRDLAIRKQLGRSSKLGKMALFAPSQSTPVGPPVDNELFQMSVALYKKDSTNTDITTRVIPSKVGSILLTQA